VARWLATTFAALDLRDFRVLWIGTALSGLAFMMSMTAQNVVAFDLSGNNRAVGLVMFGQGVAMLFISPFGGALADRLSKRLLLLVCQLAIGLTMFATALLIAVDAISVFFLAVGAFVMGTMFSFLGPARQAYVGEVVPLDRRGNAVALSQVAMNLTRVIGPSLAGVMLAVSVIGAAGTYFFMGVIFVVVVATLLRLPPTRASAPSGTSVLGEIRAGLRHVTENPRLFNLVAGFVLVTMVGFPYMTVMPGFVTEELGQGAAAYGILLAVSAVGGLLVSLAVASVADSRRAPLLLTLMSGGLGVMLIVTGMAPTFAAALVTMFGVGGCVSGFQALNSALTLHSTSPAYYGRVMSITMLAFSATGIIGLPIGMLADAIGERTTLMVMGVAVLVVVAGLAVWSARVAGHAPVSHEDIAAD
jgi:MFS family permease